MICGAVASDQRGICGDRLYRMVDTLTAEDRLRTGQLVNLEWTSKMLVDRDRLQLCLRRVPGLEPRGLRSR